MEPLDRWLFRGELLEVGTFRVRPEDPRFANTGPIREHIFVFPRISVRIHPSSSPSVVADPNTVMFYNRAQEYQRAPVSHEGDRCDWFVIREDVLVEAMAAYDPSVREHPSQPFARQWGQCPPEVYLFQRRLTDLLQGEAEPESFAVEECVLAILEHLNVLTFTHAPRSSPRARAELAEATRAVLGRSFREPLALATLAAEVHSSPFHLSRVFRAHTGMSVHRYLTDLRLRASLDRLGDASGRLTELALELGFASHSHFSERFRATFGIPPAASRQLDGRTLNALRAELEGRARI